MRGTVLRNYIPHNKPMYVNFELWFRYHKKDLINLFNIFRETIEKEFYVNKNIWTNITFTKFVYFVFECSSKYYKIEFKDSDT